MPGTQRNELTQAVNFHQRGRLAEAIRTYLDVLRREPNNTTALNLLGLAYFQQGDGERARSSVEKALSLQPDLPGASYNLGAILQALGRNEEAVAQYERAIKTNPNDIQALNNLGTALRALTRHAEAIGCYERAILLRPDYVEAHFNLGNTLQTLDRYDEAVRCYQQAVSLKPDFVVAHVHLGVALQALERHADAVSTLQRAVALRPDFADAHARLGSALNAAARPEEAVRHCEKALAIEPNNVTAHYNRGVALQVLHREAEAIPHYERVIALQPDHVDGHMNLGTALRSLNRSTEAAPYLEKAVKLNPGYAVAHMNYGNVLDSLGRSEQALDHFNQAIALKPDDAASKLSKSFCCLGLGRLNEGWELYEERWAAMPERRPRLYEGPRWDGGRARTLLVWGEQGLGDQILFSSMIEDVAQRVDNLVLEVSPRLVDLFRRSFPGVHVVAMEEPLYSGSVDAHVPIGSLGRLFRRSGADFPRRERGYLISDRSRATALRERLKRDRRPVVGLSWISFNPLTGTSKSAKLKDFASIIQLPDCRFVDLQYGDPSAERDAVERELGVHIEKLDDIDNTHDIDGLAALISACDAVVSVSNTNAHLAGALGALTWTLVPHGHSRMWYWFRQHRDSPWYPAVKVRHQASEQPWGELASSVAAEIADAFSAVERA